MLFFSEKAPGPEMNLCIWFNQMWPKQVSVCHKFQNWWMFFWERLQCMQSLLSELFFQDLLEVDFLCETRFQTKSSHLMTCMVFSVPLPIPGQMCCCADSDFRCNTLKSPLQGFVDMTQSNLAWISKMAQKSAVCWSCFTSFKFHFTVCSQNWECLVF